MEERNLCGVILAVIILIICLHSEGEKRENRLDRGLREGRRIRVDGIEGHLGTKDLPPVKQEIGAHLGTKDLPPVKLGAHLGTKDLPPVNDERQQEQCGGMFFWGNDALFRLSVKISWMFTECTS
ncbi:hypothetical protein KP509_10G077400 [Ceratopteris richardii]|uniref:Uncharacterized protein n=1 Tax=Ceratopteris richardii TaxID=49495 RepID=A0A8T2U3B4_CERRI|nr:hypothetical protein KP509_10G077400 [Ceratopteris richardii]